MKSLVIGYGSIGSRHARILRELGHRVEAVSSRSHAGIRCHPSIPSAFADTEDDPFGYVIVANHTAGHLSAVQALSKLAFAGKVLVEKPLFDSPEVTGDLPFSSCHVAYNLRFHPLLARLRQLLAGQRCLSAMAYAGQYLPNWRPDADYTKAYSTRRADGGGVLRDLSHELDYVSLLFGPWMRVTALGGHLSELVGDSDDIAALQITHRDCPIVQVQLNYLDRMGRRFLLINTNERTFELDFDKGVLRVDATVVTHQVDRDLTYRDMHTSILTRQHGACTLPEGQDVLQLIAAAEQSVRYGNTQCRA